MYKYFLLVLSLVLITTIAHAQDSAVEEVVVTGIRASTNQEVRVLELQVL